MTDTPKNVADDILDAILTEVLQRAYPLGSALMEKERGLALLRYGARRVVSSPMLAQELLGDEGAGHLGRALVLVGQRLVANGERMQELATEAEVAAGRTDP